MMTMGSLNHINVAKTLGICPGESLQLVTQLSTHGSLLEHVRRNKNKLSPQRLLNWCVQIAKVRDPHISQILLGVKRHCVFSHLSA